MKKLSTYLALFVGLIAAGLFCGMQLEKHHARHKKRKIFQQEGFHPVAKAEHQVTEQKPFVIVSLSWNNAEYCEESLLSIFNQDYDNYRLVYVDDASSDGTYEKVQHIVEREGQSHRVTLLRNEKNRGAMANWYHITHACDPNEIVVCVDGDDALAHEGVLSKLNAYYANPDVWMTFGQWVSTPAYKRGLCRSYDPKIVEKKGFRGHPFWASHLRTYYAGLFQQIKLEEFIYEGAFYPRGCDVAIMTPLLELCGKHAYFVPDVMYRYRFDNPLSDHALDHPEQLACEASVQKRHAYSLLAERPTSPLKEGECADMVIFSYNRPLQLYAFLESIEKNVEGIDQIFVLYRSDGAYDEGYQMVEKRFPDLVMLRQSNDDPKADFKPLLMKALYEQSLANYVIFGVDDIITTGRIDVKKGTAALKKTGAYGFYYRLGQNTTYNYMCDFHQGIPPLFEVEPDVYAWQFDTGKGDWDYPNSVDLTLFDRHLIHDDLQAMKFHNPSWFEGKWAAQADHTKIGLVHDHSKMVNLPLNLVSFEFENRFMGSYTVEELHEKLMNGLKIDISPLQGIDNQSAHMDYELTFTTR